MPELNVDTLNCVYFALFFVGVGYALFIVITGGLSDIDLPNVILTSRRLICPVTWTSLAPTSTSADRTSR
jgi:hypothetical protein